MNREPAGPNPDEVAHDSVPIIKRECSDDLEIPSHHRRPIFKRERRDEPGVPSHGFHHAFKRESHTPPLEFERESDMLPLTRETLPDRLRMPSYDPRAPNRESDRLPLTRETLRDWHRLPPSPMMFQRHRSWSQAEQANTAQYREMNMADAKLFVECLPEAPAEIDQKLGSIFGRVTWASGERRENQDLARQYCKESRGLAQICAGKNQWSQLFLDLLQPLRRRYPGILAGAVSSLPWLSAPCPSDHAPPRPSRRDSLNGLSAPKPYIALGLRDTAFPQRQCTLLSMMQETNYLISNPYARQTNLRFPFLVIECRAGAAGGNLIGAQNQAAVAGACALNILEDFQALARQDPYGLRVQQGPGVLFSVTTEGPLHEIWVHYRVGAEYHMTCHGAWRTTFPEDARKFVEALARIVEWGRTGFRESVLNLLGPLVDEDD